jgi:hypothetical protein
VAGVLESLGTFVTKAMRGIEMNHKFFLFQVPEWGTIVCSYCKQRIFDWRTADKLMVTDSFHDYSNAWTAETMRVNVVL